MALQMVLQKAIESSDTTALLVGPSLFPGTGGLIQIDSENISYVMSSDNQLYDLVRGMNGTTPAAHLVGAVITLLEAYPFDPEQPARVETNAVSHAYLPPSVSITVPTPVLPQIDVDQFNVINVNASSSSNATLGRASSFGVLGDTAVTNTGSTVIQGDLGISPGTSITGFPPGTYTGALHQTDTAAANAHTDATAAATALDAVTPVIDISSTDLGGDTVVPGHYDASSSGTWAAGPLTLNGAGVYIFTFDTSLTMPANASVVLTNGATADNVYFITGTTFTFGANCTVNGTILAGTSITFAANSVLNGRALTYGPSGTTVTFPSAGTVIVPPSQTWTLPAPTLNLVGHVLHVTASGTATQMVNGVSITPGHGQMFVWDVLAQAWAVVA